ncbi:MAG: med21 domain-containing protein [Planctomycetaceae bacterium]|nr:med21 domain-containing protein [Planctomycetaceae bacterium]
MTNSGLDFPGRGESLMMTCEILDAAGTSPNQNGVLLRMTYSQLQKGRTMKLINTLAMALLLAQFSATVGYAQELPPAAEADNAVTPSTDPPTDVSSTDTPAADTPATDGGPGDAASLDDVGNQARELASQTKEKVGELADTLDKTEAAQEVSAGVLKPIYLVADSLAFPGFYWVAFMLMVAGSVSYLLQLVFGKVVVLSKGSMNVREILSDSVALSISVIGLVLTTQAATQNSTFSSTPSAVLSATVVGGVLGLCLYRWGQAEEVDAARGRKAARGDKPK